MSTSVILSIASLLTVLTAALQYLLQLDSKSVSHKSAGGDFAALRRKMERYWSKAELHEEAVHGISRTYNQIGKTAPLTPRWIWKYSLKTTEREAEEPKTDFFLPHEAPELYPKKTL